MPCLRAEPGYMILAMEGTRRMRAGVACIAEWAACHWHAQATVGTLVAKVLTNSTQNPYQAAGQAVRTSAPTALDAFSVQVCQGPTFCHRYTYFLRALALPRTF